MKKEGWPAFPYQWETKKKWDMSSLRDIASHLKDTTSARRERSSSGYRGVPSDMEKQIFQHIEDLEQQVFELEDALQASLQIIDNNRPSVRARRVLNWSLERLRDFKQSLQQSTTYWILGFLGILITVYAVAKYVLQYVVK